MDGNARRKGSVAIARNLGPAASGAQSTGANELSRGSQTASRLAAADTLNAPGDPRLDQTENSLARLRSRCL